jgi:hypothetical protein
LRLDYTTALETSQTVKHGRLLVLDQKPSLTHAALAIVRSVGVEKTVCAQSTARHQTTNTIPQGFVLRCTIEVGSGSWLCENDFGPLKTR